MGESQTGRELAILQERFSLSEKAVRRLRRYDELLIETQAHTNLISPGTVAERWERHYADSLQLLPLIPDAASSLLDIGTGAGFPGLLLAIAAADERSCLHLTLVDSVRKKARFVQEAADALELSNVTVSADRAEAFHVKQTFDVITARAVTALTKLFALSTPMLSANGVLIFPKGQKASEELTTARNNWQFHVKQVPSVTHPEASILIISGIGQRH